MINKYRVMIASLFAITLSLFIPETRANKTCTPRITAKALTILTKTCPILGEICENNYTKNTFELKRSCNKTWRSYYSSALTHAKTKKISSKYKGKGPYFVHMAHECYRDLVQMCNYIGTNKNQHVSQMCYRERNKIDSYLRKVKEINKCLRFKNVSKLKRMQVKKGKRINLKGYPGAPKGRTTGTVFNKRQDFLDYIKYKAKPGDHIFIKIQFGFEHDAIYIGNNQVIHYNGPIGIRGSVHAMVKQESLGVFLNRKPFPGAGFVHSPLKYSRKEVIRRARLRLGERDYAPLRRNCQHFAMWVRTGGVIQVQDINIDKKIKSGKETGYFGFATIRNNEFRNDRYLNRSYKLVRFRVKGGFSKITKVPRVESYLPDSDKKSLHRHRWYKFLSSNKKEASFLLWAENGNSKYRLKIRVEFFK